MVMTSKTRHRKHFFWLITLPLIWPLLLAAEVKRSCKWVNHFISCNCTHLIAYGLSSQPPLPLYLCVPFGGNFRLTELHKHSFKNLFNFNPPLYVTIGGVVDNVVNELCPESTWQNIDTDSECIRAFH